MIGAPLGYFGEVAQGLSAPSTIFALDYALYAPNNPVNWPVGTASVGGSGTPTWSLSDNDGGNFQIDATTGVVSKATATTLTTATHSITISVSGVSPSPADATVSIPVAPSLDFSQPGNVVLH